MSFSILCQSLLTYRFQNRAITFVHDIFNSRNCIVGREPYFHRKSKNRPQQLPIYISFFRPFKPYSRFQLTKGIKKEIGIQVSDISIRNSDIPVENPFSVQLLKLGHVLVQSFESKLCFIVRIRMYKMYKKRQISTKMHSNNSYTQSE